MIVAVTQATISVTLSLLGCLILTAEMKIIGGGVDGTSLITKDQLQWRNFDTAGRQTGKTGEEEAAAAATWDYKSQVI